MSSRIYTKGLFDSVILESELKLRYCPTCSKNDLSTIFNQGQLKLFGDRYYCPNCDKVVHKSETDTLQNIRDKKINKILK